VIRENERRDGVINIALRGRAADLLLGRRITSTLVAEAAAIP
jgi:hypothetical protein